MCERCAEKDALISALRGLANGMQDTIVNLAEAFDVARPHLPEAARPVVDDLTAQARKMAQTHV